MTQEQRIAENIKRRYETLTTYTHEFYLKDSNTLCLGITTPQKITRNIEIEVSFVDDTDTAYTQVFDLECVTDGSWMDIQIDASLNVVELFSVKISFHDVYLAHSFLLTDGRRPLMHTSDPGLATVFLKNYGVRENVGIRVDAENKKLREIYMRLK